MDFANPHRVGQLHIKVDDLQSIFKKAHSKKVDVKIGFDGGADPKDGIFLLTINYKMLHSDGDGTEEGQLYLNHNLVGDKWRTHLLTNASPIGGKPIIPAAISNLEVRIKSDRKTEFHVLYDNPTQNREINLDVVRVPGKSVQVVITEKGTMILHDLTFKAGDIDFKSLDGVFNIDVEGTSLGDPVKGFIKGDKSAKGHSVQVNLEKGNKKLLQLDSKIRVDMAAMKIEAKTKYALLGKISGSLVMKFDQGTFSLKNTDK